MSPEQTAKLLEQPDTRTTQGLRDRAMMMLMLDSGLRVSEALGLEAERIEGVRVSPHTLRHTFAVMCVRNGGDSFSLREILGHSTLEMTRRYVHLARRDVAERHKKFSPMEHLCAGGQDHWSRSLPMGPP
jgi:site-specific recombinase XerD